VEADQARHARRARELEVEYFDSDRVLSRLLDLAACDRAPPLLLAIAHRGSSASAKAS